MTVTELRDARRALERRLAEAIQSEISAFEERTGVAVSGAYVSMAEVQEIGKRPRYVVERVTAEIDL